MATSVRAKYRGGYLFTPEYVRDRFGVPGNIYAVEIQPGTGNIVFWSHNAQDALLVREGEVAPIVRRNGEP